MSQMQSPPPADAQGRRVLLLAPSARTDLDDLQALAARLYLDSLRDAHRVLPEIVVCDPDGKLPHDLTARLGLLHPPTRLAVEGLPPVEGIVCPPLQPLMTQAMLALEWVRREAVAEVITVDLSGVGFYLALALRQDLVARPVTLTLIETGGAKDHDLNAARFPDFPEIGLYHMEAETQRRDHHRLQPRVTASDAAGADVPTRLLFLIADSGVVELDWIDRLLPRLAEGQRVEEVQFLHPGSPLTPAQKAKAAHAAGRIGAAVRFLTSAGERPGLTGPTLAIIVARGGAGALLAHLAARWALPVASAHPQPEGMDGIIRLPMSPSLAASAIDTALTAPPAIGHPTWETLSAAPPPVPVFPEPGAQPLVSICLVTFNRPATLKQTLEALEAQTFKDFEIILVDDGSQTPDATAYLDAITPQIVAKGGQVIRKHNGFPGAARNTAVAAARGAFVLFVDDDNLPKPLMIERFVTAARASGADILTCFCDSFTTLGPMGPKTDGRRLFLGGGLGLTPLYNLLGDVNALVRRSTFLALGGFTEDYGIGVEDWEFFATAAAAGVRMEVLPEALFHYRVSPQGVTADTQSERNLFRSMRPHLAAPGSPLGYFALRALAESFKLGPFSDKKARP